MTNMSISASAENLSTGTQSCDGGSMCLELALEGERLCKAGDCRAGVVFFEAAIQAGTDDLRTLSAIYSQLGNAYFYLGDYNKAKQFHKHDLTLARRMGDKLGEAKASGNLGNTLKVMGKFKEAIQCCKRHLDISRELGDRLSEGRALYNLGNVFHAQGKQLGRVGQNDPGHFPQEVRECLIEAVSYYEQNLNLMRTLGDRQACGRACGNLGNTCYLLGDFSNAIKYHTERLQIAHEFGDKAAERRANSNLGNSHIFLGQFENAAEHYKCTLALAEELGDAAVEAQACYSLGNTYTLLREYRIAEEYHARHLTAARRLQDRVGEGRACWSLGNAHAALGNHEKALYYATEHYTISKELGDVLGLATARMNVSDLRKVLGLPMSDCEGSLSPMDEDQASPQSPFNALRVRRQSMEQLSLIQLTPDGKQKQNEQNAKRAEVIRSESEENPVESFFDLLSRCQSERMDDQRATLNAMNKENRPKFKMNSSKLQRSASSGAKHGRHDDMKEERTPKLKFDMATDTMLALIDTLQGERMDSQRAELRPIASVTPSPNQPQAHGASLPGPSDRPIVSSKPEEDFLDMIARVQGSRIEDQRTVLPRPVVAAAPAPESVQQPNPVPEPVVTVKPVQVPVSSGKQALVETPAAKPTSVSKPAKQTATTKQEEPRSKTVPDEDFFNLLLKAQAAGRMDDQRATIPNQIRPTGSKEESTK